MNGAFNIGSLIGDFNDESSQIRKRNQDQENIDTQRATKVFESLANADDPDIRAAAVTGLLTGSHPADAMGKWFGKVQQHPAYQQIHQLVNEGHQPFIDPTKRKAAELDAEMEGMQATATKMGAPLTPEEVHRGMLGKLGAPPPRPMPRQSGTIVHADGTSEAGFFDPNDGQHYDVYGSPAYDMKDFRRNGLHDANPAAGGTWTVVADKASPTGYSKVHLDTGGKELARQSGAPPPSSATESFTPVVTTAGVSKFGNKSGTVSPAVGGAGVAHPEPPSAGITAAKDVEASIIKAAGPRPVPLAAGLSVDPQKLKVWQAEVDKQAKNYGYDNYAAVQAAVGSAGKKVGSAVVGGPPPAAPGAAGAKKKSAPTPDSINEVLKILK